ncbi:LamG domain-containing protein [Terrimicrobium sacchariphilum]|nr:LamG domain-containing protein [Terrimicrobium sacchariphilum]
MKILLAALCAFSLAAASSLGIVVTGTADLPAVKSYVQNLTIVHDGSMMNSKAELDFIKGKIQSNTEPWKTYYTNLTKSGHSKLTRTPQAVAEPTTQSGFLGDSYAAYNQALIFYFTGDVQYAQNARTLILAWASTVQNFGQVGANWYLAPAWAASVFAPAAELLRNTPGSGWTAADTASVQAMFSRAFLPVLKFRYAYGNRELSVCNALVAIGIFNDDRAALYMGLHQWVSYVPCYFYLASDGATPIQADYFITQPDANTLWAMHQDLYPTMGSSADWLYTYNSGYPNYPFAGKGDDKTMMLMPAASGYTLMDQWYMGANRNSIVNPVPAFVDGLCGETFRDLGHVEFGFTAAMNVAEIAWRQGIDLYSGYQDRIAKFLELHAGFRLSEPLPAALASSGVLNAGDGMAAPFEIAYDRFHDNLGVALPKLEQLLPVIRSELWYRTAAPAGIFASGLWGQQYYHIQWESLLHQGLPPESLFPTSGLVGYYGLEQNVSDASGAGNNGTALAGAGYSSDAVEGGLAGMYDGAGARMVIPDSPSLRMTTALTMGAFVKVQSSSFTARPNLIAKSFNNGYRLRFNTNGTLNLLVGNGSSSPTQFNGTQVVPLNVWTHVAAVVEINGGTATVRFYVDGVADSNVPTAALAQIKVGSGALVLGTRLDQTSTTESLVGLLDQVTIHNRALSPAEVLQMCQ